MKKLKPLYGHIICIVTLSCLLLVTALIPRKYFQDTSSLGMNHSQNPEENIQMTHSRRAELFTLYNDYLRYSDMGPERMRFSMQVQEMDSEDDLADALGEDKANRFSEILETFFEMFVYDRQTHSVQSQGMELVTLIDRDGASMEVVRIYYEWHGDWRNWMEFIIDADTEEIYYLCISSGCEENGEEYADEAGAFENAQEAVYWWADYRDLEFLDIESVTGGLYQLSSKFGRGNDVLKYLVGWKYAPGSLVDIRYLMQA